MNYQEDKCRIRIDYFVLLDLLLYQLDFCWRSEYPLITLLCVREKVLTTGKTRQTPVGLRPQATLMEGSARELV